MECRTSIVLALAFLSACIGCNAMRHKTHDTTHQPRHAWFKKAHNPADSKNPLSSPMAEASKDDESPLMAWAKKDPPKTGRKPKAATCVAWAVFRERSAKLAQSDAEKQRLLDEARKAYQQALEGEPKNLQALAGLARVYTEMGKDERALEAFAKVIKDHPKEAGVWFTLGEHYKMRKDWPEAAKSYYQAHTLDPENRKYMQWLSFSLASAGQHEEAYTWLAKANSPATAHYNLAQLFLQQGDEERGRRHLRQALEINPAHGEAIAMMERLSAPPQVQQAQQTPQALPAAVPEPAPATATLPPPNSPLHALPPGSTPQTAMPHAVMAPPVAQIGFSPESSATPPPQAP